MGVRRLLGGVALGAALALLAPAAALADETLAPSGELVYSWHGDPARGCARVGVCDIAGVLIVRPQDPAFLNTFGHHIPAMLDISGATATVRVRRTDPGSGGDCIDTDVWPAEGSGALTVTWTAGGSATASIPGITGPSSGRCAGPVDGQLGATLHGHRTAGPHPSFSFPARSTFTAGPFSGTLVSTLSFRPDTSANGISSGSGSSETSSPPTGPPPRTALFEQVTVRIRLRAAASTLAVSFAGVADPACAIFDACDTAGRLTVDVSPASTTVAISAQRRVTHRVSRARALADFRAGRLTTSLPLGDLTGHLRVSETLARSGGPTCSATDHPRDTVQLFLGPLFGSSQAAQVPVLVTGAPGPGASAILRTACPGPDDLDVFGVAEILARASVARAQLLLAHSTLLIPADRSFSTLAYQGQTSGAIALTLSRVGVSAGTVREPVG